MLGLASGLALVLACPESVQVPGQQGLALERAQALVQDWDSARVREPVQAGQAPVARWRQSRIHHRKMQEA